MDTIIKKGDVKRDMNEKKAAAATMLIAEFTEEEFEIQMLIREKYSLSEEMKIRRKKLNGTISDEEWNEYNAYVEDCIRTVQEKQPEDNDEE